MCTSARSCSIEALCVKSRDKLSRVCVCLSRKVDVVGVGCINPSRCRLHLSSRTPAVGSLSLRLLYYIYVYDTRPISWLFFRFSSVYKYITTGCARVFHGGLFLMTAALSSLGCRYRCQEVNFVAATERIRTVTSVSLRTFFDDFALVRVQDH